MKELKYFDKITNDQQPKKEHRGTKRWIIAEGRKHWPMQLKRNFSTEVAFHRIMTALKTNHLKQGDIYFERDYKHDRTENLFNMHCFMSASVMLRLDCTLYYDYEIEYSFGDCLYEAEIRRLLRIGPLDTQAKEIQLKPDFKAYFQHVLNYHPATFIHTF